MTERDAIDGLHRDVDGNALLVGPDCPECNRRHVAVYRCLSCEYRLEVPGEFRWYWQGRGHWHHADNPDWRTPLRAHLDDEHDGGGCFVPMKETLWTTESGNP